MTQRDLFDASTRIEADGRTSPDASLSQWFTPFWAAEELVDDALRDMGRVDVVEPSCGTGSFLSAIPADLHAFGVDVDPRMAAAAAAASGRDAIVGDFRTVDLGERSYQAMIGNPPFETAVIDAFLGRAHRELPSDGLAALVLPAYAFQTPSRVEPWMGMFSIDVSMIPRTLFPGISMPLVWAKFFRTATRRHRGLLLFAETRSIEGMRPAFRDALARPGTWREAVAAALRSIGGQGSVQAICDAMAPERRCTSHWRAKIRQTLQRGFRPLGGARWALPTTA